MQLDFSSFMPANPKKAIIIGCGIAGPVLALALNRAGIDSEIFEEKKPSGYNSGLFHYLSPNGMNVFNTLRIYEKIKNIGNDCNGVVHYNEKGKMFAMMDERGSEKLYGARSIMIKRSVLTKALREEVISNGINLNFGKKLKNIESIDDGKVVAYFEDGTSTQGDFLVGCDGLHSRTRHIMMPDAPKPVYTNVIGSGGYSHIPITNKTSKIIHSNYCKRAYLAYYVLPNGEIWWWCNMYNSQEQTKEELQKISNEQWQKDLVDSYSEDHDIIQEIVKSPHDEFIKLPIYEMPPVETWYKDNVCLIGDAVHALTPHAGQGASLAMEDAIVLAKCLRDIDNTQKAFAKFQQLRKQRVEKMSKLAHNAGEGYFVTNPIKKMFRNTMIKLVLSSFIFKRMAKFFFGYKTDWEEKIK